MECDQSVVKMERSLEQTRKQNHLRHEGEEKKTGEDKTRKANPRWSVDVIKPSRFRTSHLQTLADRTRLD